MSLTKEKVSQALDVLLQTVDWETTTEKQIKSALRDQLGDEVMDHTALIKVKTPTYTYTLPASGFATILLIVQS